MIHEVKKTDPSHPIFSKIESPLYIDLVPIDAAIMSVDSHKRVNAPTIPMIVSDRILNSDFVSILFENPE